jgi:hypothetical protein
MGKVGKQKKVLGPVSRLREWEREQLFLEKMFVLVRRVMGSPWRESIPKTLSLPEPYRQSSYEFLEYAQKHSQNGRI